MVQRQRFQVLCSTWACRRRQFVSKVGWKARHETMPDCYLREAQTLLIEAQQKCLTYLCKGGGLVRLEGTYPLGAEAEKQEEYRRSHAMATQSLPATTAARVPAAFLDECHDAAGRIAEERLDLEKTIFKEGGDFSECLEDDDKSSFGYSASLADAEDKKDLMAADAEPEQALDEEDTEGVTSH